MTRSVSNRKNEMTAALQEIAGDVWAMEPRAMSFMVSQMMQMAETGKKVADVVPRQAMSLVAASDGGGVVAVIPVTGVIRPHNDAITRRMGGTALSVVVAEYIAAINNAQVKSIVFFFDTPGGSVAGLADASAVISANLDKKPTSGMIGTMCASAGYWLASGIPNLRASADSQVGSIGVYVMDVSVTRAWQEFGVDIDVVHFGERKVDGQPFAPLSAGRHDAFQQRVDEYGMAFVEHVAKGRKVTPEKVRAEFGDGDIFPGSKALTRGMIDAVVPMFGTQAGSGESDDEPSMKITKSEPLARVERPVEQATEHHSFSSLQLIADMAAQLVDHVPAFSQNIDLGHVVSMVNHVNTPAAVIGSVASGPNDLANSPATKEYYSMAHSARVKSALFATGFTQKQDADDAVCDAAINAFYMAKGIAKPEAEATILADLTSVLQRPSASSAGPTTVATATAPAMSAEDYCERLGNFQAAADLINTGRPQAIITGDMVKAAVNADNFRKPLEAAQTEWLAQARADQPVVHIATAGSGEDRLTADAVDALVFQATDGRKGKKNALYRNPMAIARHCLAATGLLASIPMEDVHTQAERALGFNQDGSILAAGPVNRAGDFPNIMHAVTTAIMDDAAARPDLSFQRISYQLPDATSMDPTSIGGYAVIDGLDAHVDGDDVTEKKLAEESKGWIIPVLYANDVFLTPLMMIDAMKFERFLRALADLYNAGPRQLNRSVISLFANNPTLIDGVALFHSTHGNLIASGNGAPSETTLLLNREAHATQRAPGAMTKSGTSPSIVLVPDALQMTALKAFKTQLSYVGGQAVANVESSQNIFKDRIEVVSDPELDNFSTSYWYSLVEPSNEGLRSIVHRYLAGYGPAGKRGEYMDNKKRARGYSVDYAAGCALTLYRGIVRNNG
jgi:ClpP class serine protease